MKNNNHLLDDFLRTQVEEADLNYKEAYWEKMSTILDEEEKKKRFPFFWRGLSVILILLSISIAAYLSPLFSNKSNAKKVQKVKTEQQSLISVRQDIPLENQHSDKNSNSTSNLIVDIDSKEKVVKKDKVNQVSTQKVVSTLELKSNAIETEPKNQGGQSNLSVSNQPLSNGANKLKTSQSKDLNSQNQTATQIVKEDGSTQPNDKILQARVAKFEKVQTKNKVRESRSKHSENIKKEAILSHRSYTSTSKSHDLIIPYSQMNDNLPIQASIQTVSIKGREMKPIDTIQYTKKIDRDPSLDNPRYIASLANYIPERLDSVTVISYQPLKAIPEEIMIQKADTKKAFEKRLFELVILGGLNTNKGFAGNIANPVSWAFSPYVGIGFDKKMRSKLTMSSHIGFTYLNGLNSEVSMTSKKFGFGLDSTNLTVAHKKLFQLYLPVSIYYEVIKNHFLMFALGGAYSLDVSSQLNETNTSNTSGNLGKSSKVLSSSTSTKSGYSTGFNQFDMFAQIGYSYQLFNKVMLQMSYQQGFFDITKNTYFNNNLTNTQSRISIGVKYNFKRK